MQEPENSFPKHPENIQQSEASEAQTFAAFSFFEKLKTKWLVVILLTLSNIAIFVAIIYIVRSDSNHGIKIQPTQTTIPSPTPTVSITHTPTPVSLNISNLELEVNRKEYSYSGIGSDGAVVDVSAYYFKNNPSEMISNIEEQLNKNDNWVITDILDQRDGEGNGWWRIFAKKEEPNLKVTLTVNQRELFIVEEWYWGKIKFNYPVDFPVELKTKIPPRWIVMGINQSGWKITQIEYTDLAQATKELSPSYLASHGWLYGFGSPGVDGYMKYDKELTIASCSTKYASCLNELIIILKDRKLEQ